MAAERAIAGHEAPQHEAEVMNAHEAAPSNTKFSADGNLPDVAKPEETPRASASDLAYGEEKKDKYIEGDIMYEQLAHRFAYRDQMSALDHAWLEAQGLKAGKIVKGKNGFAMMAFTPLPGFDDKRRPVLAFRGSDDTQDWLDNFNSKGIGAAQMAANEGMIGAA